MKNALEDNAQDINFVMEVHNLLKQSDNYSKSSASLYQYCRDEPDLDKTGATADFTINNTTGLLK